MIFEVIILVLLSQFLLGIYLWYRVKDFYKSPNLLGFPIIGNLYYFYKGFLPISIAAYNKYLEKVVEKYGDGKMCFTLIYGRRTVILSCPHITEKVAFHPNLSYKDPLAYGCLNNIIDGVFAYHRSDNEWKIRRKEFNNALSKNHIEGEYHDEFVSITKNLMETMAANPKKVELPYQLTFFTINVVLGTLCRKKILLRLNRKIYIFINIISSSISTAFVNPLYGFVLFHSTSILERVFQSKLTELREKVTGNLERKIKKMEQCSTDDHANVPLSLAIILRNKKQNLPYTHLARELNELIMTGSKTVAVTLTNALACLAVFPDIQEKAWKEQYGIFGIDTRDPTVEDVKQMHYLDRFLKETLRFFAPPTVLKWATGEVNIDGTVVTAGTSVMILLHKMRMDPNHWKNPEVFDPDRFLEEDSRPKCSYLPFGVGIRSCPGILYSKQEMKITLSAVLRRFKVSSTQKFEDFKIQKNIMIEITNLSYFQVEERKYFH